MPLTEWPMVSVIMPCRNEARHIEACLESILRTDYPPDRLELLVADGRSDDGTRETVAAVTRRDPRVRLLDNPGRTAPAALNVGIRHARGEIIARMDAHVIYPPEYLPTLVAALEEYGADNVGCVLETLPAGPGPMARAVAAGLSHPLGVGNSRFRIGASAPQWVDTVAFGCFRREIFDRVGWFDEELVRNQDDEFNYRIRRRGGRILLLPDVSARYYARSQLRQVARMYYQYGWFKPLVARKVGRIMTLRQLAPPLFCLALAVGAVAGVRLPAARAALGLLAGLYLAAVGAAALRAVPRLGWRAAMGLTAVFPVLHLSYGAGFLAGLLALLRPRARRVRSNAMPLSRWDPPSLRDAPDADRA